MPQGLIGKLGEKPTRSRHCEAEQIPMCHWETGKAEGAKMRSQENCLFDIHHLTYERWGGEYAEAMLMHILFTMAVKSFLLPPEYHT